MVISTPIGRRLSSALIGMIVLATAPAQALFLDALTCELDPLYGSLLGAWAARFCRKSAAGRGQGPGLCRIVRRIALRCADGVRT